MAKLRTGSASAILFSSTILLATSALSQSTSSTEPNSHGAENESDTLKRYSEIDACLEEKFPEALRTSAIARSTCDPEQLIAPRDSGSGGGAGGSWGGG